jgi:hypothetical protein
VNDVLSRRERQGFPSPPPCTARRPPAGPLVADA